MTDVCPFVFLWCLFDEEEISDARSLNATFRGFGGGEGGGRFSLGGRYS